MCRMYSSSGDGLNLLVDVDGGDAAAVDEALVDHVNGRLNCNHKAHRQRRSIRGNMRESTTREDNGVDGQGDGADGLLSDHGGGARAGSRGRGGIGGEDARIEDALGLRGDRRAHTLLDRSGRAGRLDVGRDGRVEDEGGLQRDHEQLESSTMSKIPHTSHQPQPLDSQRHLSLR